MGDIIQILPDSVANQIAAGEVIQRPASVVKELLENAVDAEATVIEVNIKNAGKTLIQVVDDGKGMSAMDARMAFERHATSKITTADDLFKIHTFGFRGEALPSIASVSDMEIKTKTKEDPIGCRLVISASELKLQEADAVSPGTNIMVRNLFFNIPARRKFLKSDQTEWRNILNEFMRIALSAPERHLILRHNEQEIFNLPPSGLRQRIMGICGKSIDAKLIDIDCKTHILEIRGYICDPSHARKSYGEQYFFVNDRFMKHPFFHKAVTEAYKGLIADDEIPSYFLYFKIDTRLIDVNIHPTKTEIKFQNEGDHFKIILACIKEALGKFNIIPPIDFDRAGRIEYSSRDIPKNAEYIPQISYNRNYNPFNYKSGISVAESEFAPISKSAFTDFLKPTATNPETPSLFPKSGQEDIAPIDKILRINGRYIIAPIPTGMLVIHLQRMQFRLLFEEFMDSMSKEHPNSQSCLFPETLEFSKEDASIVDDILPDLEILGFRMEKEEESRYKLTAVPVCYSYSAGHSLINSLLEYYKNMPGDIKNEIRKSLALSMAKTGIIPDITLLNDREIIDMINKLFEKKEHKYDPEGKLILSVIDLEELSEKLK